MYIQSWAKAITPQSKVDSISERTNPFRRLSYFGLARVESKLVISQNIANYTDSITLSLSDLLVIG
ncbi:hypothetical protein GCM10007984_07740 [Shewanella putrefaciens]|nr:hypothetical protein GCM10007984_07740 [Shewanella putrefaciens]